MNKTKKQKKQKQKKIERQREGLTKKKIVQKRKKDKNL